MGKKFWARRREHQTIRSPGCLRTHRMGDHGTRSVAADRVLGIAVGPAAGGLGLAAGHLLAALMSPSASPVLAVGSAVIDRTPTPMKEWAIAQFGTHDKDILVGSVFAVVLILASAIGLLARARPRPAGLPAGLALCGLGAAAAACALTRPEATVLDLLPSVVAIAVAWPTLWFLTRPGPAAARLVLTGHPDPSLGSITARRRTVVIATSVVTAAALALGQTGRWLLGARSRPEDIVLPAPASPAPGFPRGLDQMVPKITPFRTANKSFYRVDTRLDVPIVDSASWRLSIDGDVQRPFTVDFADLLAMPLIERDITLTCVSNSVGGPYVGGARWLGVRLTDLLDRAGVGSGADQILSTDVDGMTISTPLALAADGRDAMVAIGMNGQALPRAHGFPARLVIPGLYGFISATKWVTRLTLTTYAERSAYWTDRDWATDAPIKISSRIDTPRPLQDIASGEVVIGGVAWAQAQGGVATVEVRIDGGPWQRATLGPSAGNDYWRQWFFRWSATPGTHQLSTRVVDGNNGKQTPARAAPFPSGASGLHSISVSVS